jgi:hypothetical protein
LTATVMRLPLIAIDQGNQWTGIAQDHRFNPCRRNLSTTASATSAS